MALESVVMAKSQYGIVSVVDVEAVFALGPKVGALTPIKGMMGLATTLNTITHPE